MIDLSELEVDLLPEEVAISAVTLAELSAGPVAASDPAEQARRQDRLQRAEALFETIPFDALAARAYGRIFAAVQARGRHSPRRFADLQIAATGLAHSLPVVTRNAADFRGLEELIDVIEV